MTYDSERDDTPSYEGEVIEVRHGMGWRARVAIGALGVAAVLAATDNWTPLIGLIVAYVAWMFLRTWLARRAQAQAWNAVNDNVMKEDGR